MNEKKYIWFQPFSISKAEDMGRGTLIENLGIKITEVGPDYLKATMPVNEKTKQPSGLLHGGASVAFAETIASYGASSTIDNSQYMCLAIEINANHVRTVKEGCVTAISNPLHIGRSTQIWEVKIIDSKTRLICISRITFSVLPIE